MEQKHFADIERIALNNKTLNSEIETPDSHVPRQIEMYLSITRLSILRLKPTALSRTVA